MDWRRIGILAGMATAPVYMSTVLLQDILRQDYNPIRQSISELAIGPFGWIQIANLIVHGLLTTLFALAVRDELLARGAKLIGSRMLAAVGVATIFLGVFVTDSGSDISWHGALHLLMAAVVLTAFPVTCFMFVGQFQKWSDFHAMKLWTLLTSAITGAFWLAAVPGSFIEAVVSTAGPYFGLLQRVAVASWSVWIFLLAIALQKAGSQPHPRARRG